MSARHLLLMLMLGVAGCAKGAPPMLSLQGRACDARPVLDGAVPVPFGPRAGVAARLGEESRCVAVPDGGGVSYAAFRLPDAPAPYEVTVTSEAGEFALVSPRVSVLDAAGRVGRMLDGRDFRAGIAGLRAGLRTRPGDRYLVAEADPATIGRPVQLRLSANEAHRVQLASQVIFIPVRPEVPEQRTEAEVTLSLNGTIRVSAAPVPLAN